MIAKLLPNVDAYEALAWWCVAGLGITGMILSVYFGVMWLRSRSRNNDDDWSDL